MVALVYLHEVTRSVSNAAENIPIRPLFLLALVPNCTAE